MKATYDRAYASTGWICPCVGNWALIWIKFGVLRVYSLELALTDFGRNLRRTHDFTDFRSAKFHEICTQYVVLRHGESFGKTFCENLPVRGLLSKNLKFCLIIVNDFQLQVAISPKWLQILESHDSLVGHM